MVDSAESIEKAKTLRGNTPLMRQYWSVKDRNPDTILLFRMGDFYETFDDDARLVHSVLGIALTKRSNGQAAAVALAGFPYHAIDNYLPKLVQAGYRVAICEQLEDPKKTKEIVKRDVVEIVTPGVSLRTQLLDPKRPQYVASVYTLPQSHRSPKPDDLAGIAYADISTGEFVVGEISTGQLNDFLGTLSPAELLVEKGREPISLGSKGRMMTTKRDDWIFTEDFARGVLTSHFETHSLKGFGVDELSVGIVAAGAVLHYLSETQKAALDHIRKISRFDATNTMLLDAQTCRNLELVQSIQVGGRDGSLIRLIDETTTPMGARLIRSWLLRPLTSESAIGSRLDAVSELTTSSALFTSVREELKPVGDLERIAARAAVGRILPRDIIYLRDTLRQIPVLKNVLSEATSELLCTIGESLNALTSVEERISAAMVDSPPALLKDGGVIRDGFNAELDELRFLAKSGKEYLAELQKRESEKTGITSLKVAYNRVFGYYLEVTHKHRDRVPADWIRKQTLVNAERYITAELKEYEDKILNAEDKMVELESTLFQELRAEVALETESLQRNAGLLASLDVLASFAETAFKRNYVRPVVDDGQIIDIRAGRHPVVEALLPDGEPFIPNDTVLDAESHQILIVTGPNMAGKSVILRQVGLIVLLAQVGSFVPADSARIGIVDRIYTRVGASDNLAAGESTFLVEMNETANILHTATPRSLILLDEVGRGTSTFDGLSIAWALVEYLHDEPTLRARTLFATHYHELNECADRLERVSNFRIQVQEHDGRLVFLRRLIAGAADHSYGIEVARMAGIPGTVLDRARSILIHLESQRLRLEESLEEAGINRGIPGVPERYSSQMSLFDQAGDQIARELLDRVESLDPEQLTPIDALIALSELKKLTKDSSEESVEHPI